MSLTDISMAVYFDHRLDTERSGINTDVSWYSGAPLLAVTSYSDESGGSVNLFLDEVIILTLLVTLKTTFSLHKNTVKHVLKSRPPVLSDHLS